MHDFQKSNGKTKIIVPLRIQPYTHTAVPTLTGHVLSEEAGTVLFGYYNMDYRLPGGDRLQLIANHDKKTVQLILYTHNPELLKQLPGARSSSLVADTINRIHAYRVRSQSYKKPLTVAQQQKLDLANQCINELIPLLQQERSLSNDAYEEQEQLKNQVLDILSHCQEQNRLVALNPIVSEGSFGQSLYHACKAASHFQFNRVYPVSTQDQMDFTDMNQDNPCFIWDSEVHIGQNEHELDDALRTICEAYALNPAASLNNVPANRLERLEAFLYQLWLDGKDWINYLTVEEKPEHETTVQERTNGISITQITPYYLFKGLKQQGYANIGQLVQELDDSASPEPILFKSMKHAQKDLSAMPNGSWGVVADATTIILRLRDELIRVRYFVEDGLFYPLPDGQDLYSLSQISKRHLYLPERVSLRFKAFISRIPTFFTHFYQRLRHFLVHDLHEEFVHHVHKDHQLPEDADAAEEELPDAHQVRRSLHDALEHHGLLHNGQTLEEFIKEQLAASPYVIARANHPPSPSAYDNPLHRGLEVFRHVASIFIDTSEQNPLVGSLALAAYFYGAGAVLAPKALESLLTKLHLSGLISGIEPVQKLGHWMSHGPFPEAISASITLWQGVVVGGNLDNFFVHAIGVLKEDPAQIAIISSLALGFGYSLTKIFPSLGHEMGEFPFTNYAALGGKSGAAIYDTIMHPGDDWLLGTCKWLCKIGIEIGKIAIAPFVEAYHYGFNDGFVSGLKKSGTVLTRLSKQSLAAVTDFLLMVLTIPLYEVSSLFIHVPFRGLHQLTTTLLSVLGDITSVSQSLLYYAKRPSISNFLSDFRLSPLYGFSSPFGDFAENWFLNGLINGLRLVFIPPLQVIKNLIILPLIDTLSLIVRLSLSVLNPLSRVVAYALGTVLNVVGGVWDKSIGTFFTWLATIITLGFNWVERQAGGLKQQLVSLIEVARHHLYHWAFQDEDARTHQELADQEYYIKKPMRCEKIPHSESHCLMHTLLAEQDEVGQIHPDQQSAHHQPLFQDEESDDSSEPKVSTAMVNQ